VDREYIKSDGPNIMAGISYLSMTSWWFLICTRPTCSHVDPLGNSFLIPNHPDCTQWLCVFRRKTVYINYTVFLFYSTLSGIQPTICCTQVEHVYQYITAAVDIIWMKIVQKLKDNPTPAQTRGYINGREHRRANQKWKIQRNWQPRVHKTEKINNTTQYVLDTTMRKQTQITWIIVREHRRGNTKWPIQTD
jgi:hypothetical protein